MLTLSFQMNIDIDFRDNVICLVPLFTMIFEQTGDERYKNFLNNLFYNVGKVELWWDINADWSNTFDLNVKITQRGQRGKVDVIRITILVKCKDSFYTEIKDELERLIKINGFNQVYQKSQYQLNIRLNKGDIKEFIFDQVMD